jgi:hypothetical protein
MLYVWCTVSSSAAVGFMMHLNGYPDEQKVLLSQQFLQVSGVSIFHLNAC